jgi:hypothetical protein
MRRLALVALLACSVGCGATTSEAPRRSDRGQGDRAVPVDDTPAQRITSPRDLAADATFADLVAAARRQDDLRAQDSSAGCLLRTRPWRLEADLAAAVRPLPEPPPSLTARLERVAVLTRYGAIGEPTAPLGLVAFTTTRPAAGAGAAVLVVTPRGLFLGRTDAARFDELDRSRLARIDDGRSQLFVTANAGVTVRELADVLAALPPMPGRIALAVALPDGTRLPEPRAASTETAPICELSALADDAPLGDLSVEALRAGVAPLADRARLCAGTTDGAGALGGRVVGGGGLSESGGPSPRPPPPRAGA